MSASLPMQSETFSVLPAPGSSELPGFLSLSRSKVEQLYKSFKEKKSLHQKKETF
jgi:hypothetical protein